MSDHRFLANFFRLFSHAAALNLLILLRNHLPEADPKARRRPAPSPDADSPLPPTGSELRQAQPATWQLRLIKVAAEVIVSSRRVLVRLSSAWPSLPTWRRVLQCIQQYYPASPSSLPRTSPPSSIPGEGDTPHVPTKKPAHKQSSPSNSTSRIIRG